MEGHVSDDHWEYNNLPSYKTIIDTHETVLRSRRDSLRVPEEAIFAVARELSQRYDDGEIDTNQFKLAFNARWNSMVDSIVKDFTALLQNAKLADDKAWDTAGKAVIAMGLVATAVIVAAAAARPVPAPEYTYVVVQRPRPINCYASRGYGRTVNIQCW